MEVSENVFMEVNQMTKKRIKDCLVRYIQDFSTKEVLLFLSSLVIFSLFILPVRSYAAPVLFNPLPTSDSYIGGGDNLFQISINESDLNTSSVTLYIISEDARDKGEDWDSYVMSCGSSTTADWLCNKSLSFAIVGSDTIELFYFQAKDNIGALGFLGTEEDSLDFTLDRNPPEIDFINPIDSNNVSSIVEIELSVTDTSSGINSSTVMYSDDNSTWNSTVLSQSNYFGNWSTLSFSDNQTVTLYAKATDNVGNIGHKDIGVVVDNEAPKITVIEPSGGGKVGGIIYLQINIEELYSGIDESLVKYAVESTERNMDCTGSLGNYTCDEYFDTTTIPDGQHTINFTATDNAGNENSTSIQINVDNTEPFVTITNPKNAAYVSGKMYINATVSNVDENVTGANISITGDNYTLSSNMSCSPVYPSSYRCYIEWNASNLTDGQYTFRADVLNIENKTVFNSIYVILDNTLPDMVIDMPPENEVNGTINPKVVVTDDNGVNPIITFNISTYNKIMNCNMQLSGKRYVCIDSFNTTQLVDGYYTLYFYAKDSAGNPNSVSRNFMINNTGASNETMVDETGPSDSTTTTTSIVLPDYTTTTTTAPTVQNVSNPIIILIGGVRDAVRPVSIVLGDIQRAIQKSLKPWSVKLLVVFLIILAIVFVLFKTGNLKRFFKEEAVEEVGEKTGKREDLERMAAEKEIEKSMGEYVERESLEDRMGKKKVDTQRWVKNLNQLKKFFEHSEEDAKKKGREEGREESSKEGVEEERYEAEENEAENEEM